MDLAWIPQLFFDLLGRVMPGVIVIVTSFIVVGGPSSALRELFRSDLLSFGSAVLWLILSYFVGVIFGQLWTSILGKLMKRRESVIDSSCVAECLAEHNKLQGVLGRPQVQISVEQFPRIFVMHDHLRFVTKDEALRLLKILAEQRLCHASFLGLTVLSIANIILFSRDRSPDRLILEAVMVIFIIACWKRIVRLRQYFATGTCVAWLSFVSAKGLLCQVESDEELGKVAVATKGRPTRGLKRTPDGAA